MPKNARNVILHTRFATQGHQSDNRNNHPVMSTDGNIILTHNGMIGNDDLIRRSTLAGVELADVDTAVIPELLSIMSPQEAVDQMEGYAACAWFDMRTGGAIHLSRFNSSPVAYGWLLDGSFVYASTEELLAVALQKAGLDWVGNYPKTFPSMSEGEYITIDDGFVYDQPTIDGSPMDGFSWGTGLGGFHNIRALSGGHGSEESRPVEAADEAWWNEQFRDEQVDEEFGVEKFYLLDQEGDITGFLNLGSLVSTLRWYNEMTVRDDDIKTSGDDRWVNYFSDIGEYSDDGGLISWVDNPEFTYAYEISTEEPILDFVRDGIQFMKSILSS